MIITMPIDGVTALNYEKCNLRSALDDGVEEERKGITTPNARQIGSAESSRFLQKERV
jgi:hypothetical protein